jgi:DNA-directed RNA polymerase subunit RPC12/RpoP
MVGVFHTARCPYCGSEVDRPLKTLDVRSRRMGCFRVSTYACPRCGRRFKIAERLP